MDNINTLMNKYFLRGKDIQPDLKQIRVEKNMENNNIRFDSNYIVFFIFSSYEMEQVEFKELSLTDQLFNDIYFTLDQFHPENDLSGNYGGNF